MLLYRTATLTCSHRTSSVLTFCRYTMDSSTVGSRLRTLLAPYFYVDRAGDPENTVVLSGSPRSGTTWIMEVLNAHQDHRLIFEPLRPQSVRLAKNFEPFMYIRRNESDSDIARVMQRVMAGRLRSLWTDRHNRTFWCNHRLVKLVRGTMAMAYLKQCFPRAPIIYVLRHPIAQILSMSQLGYSRFNATRYLDQPGLVEDHLAPFENLIQQTEGYFENLILHWCIQNYVALRQCGPNDVHLVFYEELCMDPVKHFERLYTFLGYDMNERVHQKLHAPSRMSQASSPILAKTNQGEQLIGAWRSKATTVQIDQVLEGLRCFGLDAIYSHELMPDRTAAEHWLNTPEPDVGAGRAYVSV